ncbi:CHAT domain-containing protein [Streptomyces sp. NPDC053755]|uniref:CHAT domain-containing protein n=1 Tax=Streptomyces sp. NPDC053755 TaxID=3155815 RepID=UPI00343AE712
MNGETHGPGAAEETARAAEAMSKTAEEKAGVILERVMRAEADPEALRWFLTEEARAAAEDVRRAATLPDGNVLLVGLYALGFHDWGRFLAGEATDAAALGSALLGFLDVHRAYPDRIPALLRPHLALLTGEPAGADADPGEAYQAGAGIVVLYQRHRNPVMLRAAAVLLRHSVQGFPAGSTEQGTCLSDLGLTMVYAFRDGAGPGVLADAVEISRAAVAAVPGERMEQARRHGNLGFALRYRAEATSDRAMVRESLTEMRHAIRLSERQDAFHGLYLAQLGSALVSAAVQLDDTSLLPEAVDTLREAVALATTDQPPPAAYLSDLGIALIALSIAPETTAGTESADSRTVRGRASVPPRSDRAARNALYDEGVDACRRAADSAPNIVERAMYLTHLAFVLDGRAARGGDPDALDAAYDAARDAVAAAPAGHPTRAQAQNVLSGVLRSRYLARGDIADLEAAIDSARDALDETPADDPRGTARGVDLADLLRLHARAVEAPEALCEPVALLRRLAAAAPPHSADRGRALFHLAMALGAVGDGTGEEATAAADEAVRTLRECLNPPGGGGDREAAVRFHLGTALVRRSAQVEEEGERRHLPDAPDSQEARERAERDREEGVALIRQGIALLDPDDPRRSEYLAGLGSVHVERAARKSDPARYAEAVRVLREAVACAPSGSPAEEAARRSNLGAALVGLATLTADERLLVEGVRMHRDAVDASPPDDHYRRHRLGNLGDALQQLAQFRSDARLIEEAVEVLREAVRAAGPHVPGRGGSLSRLGNALRSLSRFTGDGAPLEEAVTWHRRAVAAERETPAIGTRELGAAVPRALVGLANVLVDRYHRTHDESLRDEAFRHYRAALAAAHAPGDRTVVLTSYGWALWGRATDTADDALMDTAISTLRESVAIVPARHAGIGGVLTNLGSALMDRARITGDRTWLAEAVTVLRRAVDESPPTTFERAGLLSNLAEALRAWHEITQERAAADEAVRLLREAVALEHGERHGRDIARVNLGLLLNSLALPGQALGEEADAGLLAESRLVLEEAVAGLDDDHPQRALALMNLAAVCVVTAELADDPAGPTARASFEQAVSAAREALARVPEGYPEQARIQWLIARAQVGRALIGERADLGEAARLAQRSAHNAVAPVTVRLPAARVWGDAAAASGRHAEALAAYTYAVGLLPRLAPRNLGRADQESRLGAGVGLASDAAALALRAGDPEAALTLLEQGRGVLLAQGLESRGDLSRLRAADPALAAEFEEIREELSAGSPWPAVLRADLGAPGPHAPERRFTEAEAGRLAESRYALSRRWDALLDRIRRLPGLETFLNPPRLADLLPAAAAGPVVVVNVSRYRSDALVVTPEGRVEVVPLPDLDPTDTVNRAAEFVLAVEDAYGVQGAARARAALRTLTGTLAWLWDAVAEPVLDRLGLRTLPVDDEPWTRLWWCPTGWLSFLPLHAAGHAGSGRTVMDRAVSSYTPTLRALVRARRTPAGTSSRRPAPLVVSLAETPGAHPLPGASQEARLLRDLFPAGVHLTGPEATVDAVRRRLPSHPWVHFSCHGVSDPLEPSESGLILHDGRLTVLDAAAQRPREAVLVVLSACSTSQGGLMLPDESVHLVSSFQLAGYPHVIGTLWPVSDKVATRLTDDFYAALADDLARGRPIDPATALHAPVRALRERLVHAPHLWAAHVHNGP